MARERRAVAARSFFRLMIDGIFMVVGRVTRAQGHGIDRRGRRSLKHVEGGSAGGEKDRLAQLSDRLRAFDGRA